MRIGALVFVGGGIGLGVQGLETINGVKVGDGDTPGGSVLVGAGVRDAVGEFVAGVLVAEGVMGDAVYVGLAVWLVLAVNVGVCVLGGVQ